MERNNNRHGNSDFGGSSTIPRPTMGSRNNRVIIRGIIQLIIGLTLFFGGFGLVIWYLS